MAGYDVLVNKKQHRVKLPDLIKKRTLRIKINGKEAQVELLENICYDKPFFVKVDGKLYRVELERSGTSDSIIVRIDGVPFSARLENKNRIVSQAPTPALPVARKSFVKRPVLDKGVIAASMPGKVVLLRAEAGQTVRVGDVLLVLESMKMENEIVSPVSGIIKEIRVSEGSAVSIGETMILISET